MDLYRVGISPQNFHGLLRNNQTFRDYFNKYCCLPVFGQRVSFIAKRAKFFFDPPPVRNDQKRYKIPNDFVRDWLMNRRFPLFVRSKIFSEVNLCEALHLLRYSKEKGLRRQSSVNSSKKDDKVYLLLDDLKRRHLYKVRHMRRFLSFVESSPSEKQLVRFWLDVDFLNRCEYPKRARYLRELQKKYYVKTSPFCLPYYVLDRIYPAGAPIDAQGFDYHLTLRLQAFVLKRLHTYWVPRYLLKVKDVSKAEKLLLRKEEILAALDNDDVILHKALKKSLVAHFIPDPDADYKLLLQRARKRMGSTVVLDEDDEQNILIRREERKEIWLEEKEVTRLSGGEKSGAETLSGDREDDDDVAYIEDRIFGDLDGVPLFRNKNRERPWTARTFYARPRRASDDSLSSESSGQSSTGAQAKIVRRERIKKYLQAKETRVLTVDKTEEQYHRKKKKKRLKGIARRKGPLASDVHAQLQLKEEVPVFDPTLPRKCRSDIDQTTKFPVIVRKFSCSSLKDEKSRENIDSRVEGGALSTTLLPAVQVRGDVRQEQTTDSESDKSELDLADDSSEGSTSGSGLSGMTSLDTSVSFLESETKESSENSSAVKRRKRLQKMDRRVEYLSNVEPDMKVADILASDAVANFPFRNFLSKVPHCQEASLRMSASGDFKKKFSVDLLTAYDIWLEIENLRTEYFTLDSEELDYKFDCFLHSYAAKENSPFCWLSTVKLYKDGPFPYRLERLQKDLEKMIEQEWMNFAVEEQKGFRLAVITSDKVVLGKRYSFPNCLPEIRQLPILPQPLLTQPEDIVYKEFEARVRKGYIGRLDGEVLGHMRYRTSRAYRLLMESFGRDVGNDDRFSEFIGEESSDEEGGIPLIKPKTFVRLPYIEPKEVAKLSVREYPRAGFDYKQCVVLRMRTQQKLEGQPLYMRPLKKRGEILMRPEQRPGTLESVVRDPLHYEFFKRYMKLHNSEAPLLFWKSVELLKRTDNPVKRQKKAQQILKKFFSRVAGAGIMLQCDSEIVKEVAAVETVTTSMLVQTAIDVFKSMEKNWSDRYFSTFPKQSFEFMEEETDERRLDAEAIKTSRMWGLFTDFIRRAARFLQCMKNPKTYEDFYDYLKRQVHMPDSSLQSGDASITAILFQRWETVIYKHMNMDIEVKHRVKQVLGKSVTLNFLANDLAFWLEVDRYTAMCDNVTNLQKHGSYHKKDSVFVKEKMETIIKCFLDSYVPPKIRVNVPQSYVDEIFLVGFRKSKTSRSLFHKAMFQVFPLLIYYWRKYRREKFTYVSKRDKKLSRRAQVEERKRSILRREVLRKKRLIAANKGKFHIASLKPFHSASDEISQKNILPTTYAREMLLPDYTHDLDDKPYEKVKGLLHSDPPTLHFSMEQGLKLILPPRRRIIEKLQGEDQEDSENEFLEVWTRGAKVVNVFRQGSDPRLVNLDEAKRRFKVKCDMLES